MKKIQCETCGSHDILKIDDNHFQCSYCGVKYTSEQAKKLMMNVDGIQGYNELVKNAETFMELGDYSKAWGLFYEISNKYPHKYRGWLGLFELIFNSNIVGSGEDCTTYYERALKFSSPEERTKILTLYDDEIKRREEEAKKERQKAIKAAEEKRKKAIKSAEEIRIQEEKDKADREVWASLIKRQEKAKSKVRRFPSRLLIGMICCILLEFVNFHQIRGSLSVFTAGAVVLGVIIFVRIIRNIHYKSIINDCEMKMRALEK